MGKRFVTGIFSRSALSISVFVTFHLFAPCMNSPAALAANEIVNKSVHPQNGPGNHYKFAAQKKKSAKKPKGKEDRTKKPKETEKKKDDSGKKGKMTPKQIADKYLNSVVTITSLDENNQALAIESGFFIDTYGKVVARQHILEGCSKAIVRNSSGEEGEIRNIIQSDPALDIVVAETSVKKSFPVPIGNSDNVGPGDEIAALGAPAGSEGTLSVSAGKVRGTRESNGVKTLQITAPISPGSNGGPIVDSNGDAIGIATSSLIVGQDFNIAMPMNYLKTLRENKMDLKSFRRDKKEKPIGGIKFVTLGDVNLKKCDIPEPGLPMGSGIEYREYLEEKDSVCGIDFTVSNQSEHSIKNIQLLFIFKKQNYVYTKEQEMELSRLEEQYVFSDSSADNGSKRLNEYFKKREAVRNSAPPIKTEDTVIGYSGFTIKDILPPKIQHPFRHKHYVKWRDLDGNWGYRKLDMEIRILTYDIAGN